MFVCSHFYFYCAFVQKAPNELRFFNGIAEMKTSYTSPHFLPELFKKIAEHHGDAGIASQLVIQSLTPLH